MFTKVQDTSLKLNPAKYTFVVKTGVQLGHIVSKEGLTIDPEKVKACSLYKLTKIHGVFEWTNECQRTFEMLKKMLSMAPMMTTPP